MTIKYTDIQRAKEALLTQVANFEKLCFDYVEQVEDQNMALRDEIDQLEETIRRMMK